MATLAHDDDDFLTDDPLPEEIAWAKMDDKRFARPPRVLLSKTINGLTYDKCTAAGLYWIRRSNLAAKSVVDSPTGSENDIADLWEKILSREAH